MDAFVSLSWKGCVLFSILYLISFTSILETLILQPTSAIHAHANIVVRNRLWKAWSTPQSSIGHVDIDCSSLVLPWSEDTQAIFSLAHINAHTPPQISMFVQAGRIRKKLYLDHIWFRLKSYVSGSNVLPLYGCSASDKSLHTNGIYDHNTMCYVWEDFLTEMYNCPWPKVLEKEFRGQHNSICDCFENENHVLSI